MKYDGYDVKYYDYTSDHDGGKRFGVKIQDLRRYQGVTLSVYASIPERDAAVREWIEQQEQKPVIVPGPVVRDRIEAQTSNRRVCDMILRIEEILQAVKAWPPRRTQYDDDANHQHGVRIAERRREILTELIGSYRAELGVIQSQLKDLEHGGS